MYAEVWFFCSCLFFKRIMLDIFQLNFWHLFTDAGIGDSSRPNTKLKKVASSRNLPLRLLWLIVSSMIAVEEGNCHLCPTHSGIYPNVGNCKCYFKCINGVPIQKTCPPGKKFDVMSMSCTYASNTICAGKILNTPWRQAFLYPTYRVLQSSIFLPIILSNKFHFILFNRKSFEIKLGKDLHL